MCLTKQQLKDNVSANFRYARKQLKLTGEQLAEALEVRQINIAAIEQGRQMASAILIYKLSQFIGVSIDSIYTKELSNIKE